MGCVESLGGRTVLIAFAWQDYGDPDRPCFNPTTSGSVDFKEFFAISEDEGETWGELTKIDDAPFDATPTALTGPIRVMPNGDWACQFETNKTYDAPGPWPLEAVMMFSSDKGKTWPRFVKHAFDPARRLIYGDARPRVMPDASVLCFYWTFDTVAAKTLNIHATQSDDEGRTWTVPWDTGVPGQAAPPILLPSGDVVIAYVDRTDEPTIKVRTSHDRGRTFPDHTELALRRSISPDRRHGNHKDVHDWVEDIKLYTIGLPDTATLNDPAEFVVVYYNGIDQDHTDLEWIRLRAV